MPQYCIINITVQEDLLALYWQLAVLCRNCQYKIRHFCFNLSMLNGTWHKFANINSPINFPQANSPNITLTNNILYRHFDSHPAKSFEPLCACSIAHGDKFVKLKPANH